MVQLVQDLPELAARDGVDARRRLVEEEERRARQERRDERELLLHAARERAGEARAEAVEADAAEEVPRARGALGGRHGVEPGPQREVLVDGEVLVEREALRDEAERRRPSRDGAAGRRREEARDDPEERRLAGAVGPDEGEHLAARDREVDPAQRRAAAEAPGEPSRRGSLDGLVAVVSGGLHADVRRLARNERLVPAGVEVDLRRVDEVHALSGVSTGFGVNSASGEISVTCAGKRPPGEGVDGDLGAGCRAARARASSRG